MALRHDLYRFSHTSRLCRHQDSISMSRRYTNWPGANFMPAMLETSPSLRGTGPPCRRLLYGTYSLVNIDRCVPAARVAEWFHVGLAYAEEYRRRRHFYDAGHKAPARFRYQVIEPATYCAHRKPCIKHGYLSFSPSRRRPTFVVVNTANMFIEWISGYYRRDILDDRYYCIGDNII